MSRAADILHDLVPIHVRASRHTPPVLTHRHVYRLAARAGHRDYGSEDAYVEYVHRPDVTDN